MAMIRSLAVMGIAGVLSLMGFYFVGGASQTMGGSASLASEPLRGFVGAGYDLAQLELLELTLYHVEESYVEPSRVDFEKMYISALEAVERRVPTCMFRREAGSKMLYVQIGEFQTVLEMPEIDSRASLLMGLADVAKLLKTHVKAGDFPVDDGDNPHAEIEYSLVNGALSTLDPHSMLLPPEDSRQMDEDNKGEFGGLGITIVDRDGKLTVEYPLKDTPAERAGLQPDDHIVRIDGETTINMSLDEAVRKLRGRVGAPVVIHIMRQGLTEPLKVDIIRGRIKSNPPEGQLLDGGIAWIAVKSFNANVSADLGDLLARLGRESDGRIRGLILDLRGNPGGYLNQAVAVADQFLDEGVIVSTVDGDGREGSRENARARNTQPKYPIAILLDANSASASEIVAGALRNNERAIVIGERSFGKGSVQNLHSFVDDSKLKLTISKYLTPGGKSIQSVGIPADIEMLPVIVAPPDSKNPEDQSVALVYWRELVRREADLDKHLDRMQLQDESAAYSLTFLRPKDIRRRSSVVDLSKDEPVQFARDVLQSAPSWRRPEILASAHRVVSRYERKGEAAIREAFDELEVDWSSGPSRSDATLEIQLKLGGDGRLDAGTYEEVVLEVTNRGTETLFQLGALTNSDSQILDGREFFFGRLEPGETRSYKRRVWVLTGYPAEQMPTEITFRDSGNASLVTHTVTLPVQSVALPLLSWSWELDDSRAGNGDGIAQLNEKLDVKLTVTNVGEGPTAEAFARIKNKSGRAMDIKRGTALPGYVVDEQGQPCPPVLPGVENGEVVGDASIAPERVESGDPPTFADGCKRLLRPEESWSGTFEIQVTEQVSDQLKVELSLGDAEAYDHGVVMRSGFYEYFTNRSEVAFELGQPLPQSTPIVPPRIEVSLKPDLVVEQASITISGMIRDESGVAHVMVFDGADKVFFEGSSRGQGVAAIPFTVDLELEPGLNTISILATDVDDVSNIRSVVVFYEIPEQQAGLKDPDSK